MAITDKYRELMEQVARYFENTAKTDVDDKNRKYKLKREDTRSINDTALHFNFTRSKVTKMLITMGVYSTAVSQEAQEMRKRGMSIKEIAEKLGVSVGTVSSNLPYEDEMHGNEGASDHAMDMRKYRAYQKSIKERQIQRQPELSVSDERKEQEMRTNDATPLSGVGETPSSGVGATRTADVDKKAAAVGAIRTADQNDTDWRKDLNSKLSFTPTDSRRPRITYEMIEESRIKKRAILEAGGIELPVDDREAERERLRNKLKETGSLTPEEILDLGEFPGALYDRNSLDLEEIYGKGLPYEPREMLRLHLELDAGFSDDEKATMHRYGAMEGETISRDILVSDDLPLYALHYVIQRTFGWQNSHLHRFYLPDEAFERLTGSVEQWMEQVGVIYRSPLMDENAEFWADDYESGSFKNWLRKKYTGPCVSQCWDEGLIGARQSLKNFDPDEEYYVEFGRYGNRSEREDALPLRCRPVYGWDGKKHDPPKADKYVHNYRVEVMKARDLPVDLLNQVFERDAFDILERLPIGQVLAVRNMHCSDDFQDGEWVCTYQEMLDDGMGGEIDEILESGPDSPMKQPFVYSFTDELLYQYDFGDNWQIRITGSRNCTDLVENGRITQDMLDKSSIKARVTYRPVLLARDGEMLVDDVGGASGFAGFIKAINTMKRGEFDENGMSRTQLKEWAKSLGWHKDNSSDYHLI